MNKANSTEVQKGVTMADGNLKAIAVTLLAKFMNILSLSVDDCPDEVVDEMLRLIEDYLHKAHMLGIEFGRKGG